MLASYRGHVEVVELLLEYGSDVNLTTQVDNWIRRTLHSQPLNHLILSYVPMHVYVQCICHNKIVF